MIRVTNHLYIPENELTFTASRSTGPGGQHVNKVSTRVTLVFDLENSPTLSDEMKDRMRPRLSRHLNGDGVLRVVSGKYRSQVANRRAVVERFIDLLSSALHIPKSRRRPAVPASQKRRRLRDKTYRGRVKEARTAPIPAEE